MLVCPPPPSPSPPPTPTRKVVGEVGEQDKHAGLPVTINGATALVGREGVGGCDKTVAVERTLRRGGGGAGGGLRSL